MGQDLLAGFLGTWSAELNLGSVLLRVLLSMLLSAIVGCERSSKRHSAGISTYCTDWAEAFPCSPPPPFSARRQSAGTLFCSAPRTRSRD